MQDAAARLCALAANPKPGDKVLDACAAPGGKILAMALTMADREISWPRICTRIS